jgi:hypothetical protein
MYTLCGYCLFYLFSRGINYTIELAIGASIMNQN